jgi:multiple sugar transport system permease protein
MAGGTSTIQQTQTVAPRVGLFAGRRGRILRENLTAYLFLFPATSLILVFGLFPVAFSLYVSLYRWRIRQSDFLGLGNYTRALDNLAFVVAFGLAVGAIWFSVWLLIKTWRQARAAEETPWLLILPGVASGLAGLELLRYGVLVLPEILGIGEKVQRLEKTNELFVRLFSEALQVETAVQARQQALWLIVGAVVLQVVIHYIHPIKRTAYYLGQFFRITFFGVTGYLIGAFTLSSVQEAYTLAQEAGEPVSIWPQIISIAGGFLLVYFSWWVWNKASHQTGSGKMIGGLLAAIMLLGGGWLLIAELPLALSNGDEALWNGLRITAWYSFLTVPVQLALGMVLAYMLFQNIRGKSFFRMMYFLPYITPAVAAAAVFRIIFSNRPSGMMNKAWTFFGADPINWLLEPQSVFNIGPLEGPSLALVVIILFNVWVFTGYNTIIFLAGLGSIPGSLYEAAEIDGANRWHVFRHITIPLLSPTTYFLSVLGVIGTFKAFNHLYVLRQSAALDTVDTMSLVIWDELFTRNRYGYAATLAFVLFGVILVLTLINNKVQGERVFYG